MNSNFNKLLVISLALLISFASLVNAQEAPISTENTETPATLAICDHNGDGDRNLSDVGIFASCKDTFDANGDGIHDLTDVGEYAANNQRNDGWCNEIDTRVFGFTCDASDNLPETPASNVSQTLAICDHNGDKLRNLTDVSMFAQCADTFDANGDGIHDLSDISEYASNNQDNTWCADTFKCIPEPAQEFSSIDSVEPTSTPATLAICDHNGDGDRNLSDVGIFASCKDTFDANGDGIHDLTDVGEYASNNQDDYWCTHTFTCDASDNLPKPPVSGTPEPLAICDHNGDGLRNLSDVGIFASCKDTFDANGDGMHDLSDISEYAVNKFRNDGWCTTTFVCEAQASTSTPSILGGSTGLGGMLNKPINNQSIEPEVLGEKIESTPKPAEEEVCTYNTPDQDVLGQTEWADGTLLRGCGPEVYVIENQQKRHILSLEDLFQYIGQRIYNVTNNILNLF